MHKSSTGVLPRKSYLSICFLQARHLGYPKEPSIKKDCPSNFSLASFNAKSVRVILPPPFVFADLTETPRCVVSLATYLSTFLGRAFACLAGSFNQPNTMNGTSKQGHD